MCFNADRRVSQKAATAGFKLAPARGAIPQNWVAPFDHPSRLHFSVRGLAESREPAPPSTPCAVPRPSVAHRKTLLSSCKCTAPVTRRPAHRRSQRAVNGQNSAPQDGPEDAMSGISSSARLRRPEVGALILDERPASAASCVNQGDAHDVQILRISRLQPRHSQDGGTAFAAAPVGTLAKAQRDTESVKSELSRHAARPRLQSLINLYCSTAHKTDHGIRWRLVDGRLVTALLLTPH